MELRSLPRHQLMAAWPDVLPFLQRVDKWLDPFKVAACILTEEYQCYIVVDAGRPAAVVCTEVINEGPVRGLKIVLAAGHGLTDWFDLEHHLVDWCKAEGFSFLEGSGRPGWEKVLPHRGYRKTEVTLRKTL